eukprot:TRINITY_DN19614_c0_g1_i2.p2 TRINITY_DN19614_c0_g1~~TRINITY_DN19614_c0_g1_i2.p2  ORF type:complete len:118 (+),score=27.89 TRINITY_DN19614_c0_g1_i2:599-952(+)
MFDQNTAEEYESGPLKEVRDAGYSETVTKDYVGELTDRSLQRKLRDVSRNQEFCNVFTSEDNPDTVIFESDDVILQFKWSSANDKPSESFWFAKRSTKQMTTEERAIHLKVHTTDDH